MAKQNVAKLDTNALFTQYLNVVNKAIGQHKDEFPYSQLLKAGESVLGDKDIGVAVYENDSNNPHDFFTIGFGGTTFDIQSHGKSESLDTTWKVDQKHLENVVTSRTNTSRVQPSWIWTG